MARCGNCNKFTALEMQDPEPTSDLEVRNQDDGYAEITGSIRIVRNTECCNEEAKEHTFDIQELVELAPTEDQGIHKNHELEVMADDPEPTEDGGGRYKKSYYGYRLTGTVNCIDCDKQVGEFEVHDRVAASYMEELL